jgi:hypothetical protein
MLDGVAEIPIDNLFMGPKGWQTTAGILSNFLTHHKHTLLPNCTKLYLVSDNGTGFRQSEMLHFYTLLAEEWRLEIDAEMLAPYHGYSMCDQHAGIIGGFVHRKRMYNEVVGPEGVADIVHGWGGTAFVHKNPASCPAVKRVQDTHMKPGIKIREFLSFHVQFTKSGKRTQLVGVVTGGRFSGIKHTCLLDMRRSSHTCGHCSDTLLCPISHIGRCTLGTTSQHARHVEEEEAPLNAQEVAAGLKAAVHAADQVRAQTAPADESLKAALAALSGVPSSLQVPAPVQLASALPQSNLQSPPADRAATGPPNPTQIAAQTLPPLSAPQPSPEPIPAHAPTTTAQEEPQVAVLSAADDSDDDKPLIVHKPSVKPWIPAHARKPRTIPKPKPEKKPPKKRAQKREKSDEVASEEPVEIYGEKWVFGQRQYLFRYVNTGVKGVIVAEECRPYKRQRIPDKWADNNPWWEPYIKAWRDVGNKAPVSHIPCNMQIVCNVRNVQRVNVCNLSLSL